MGISSMIPNSTGSTGTTRILLSVFLRTTDPSLYRYDGTDYIRVIGAYNGLLLLPTRDE